MQYHKLTAFNVRRLFDPSKKEDVQELKYFLANSKWKTLCPFYLEDPWDNIPVMCKEKFTRYTLGIN